MLFGKRHRSAAPRNSGRVRTPEQPELYAVAYEKMLKGNKLSRHGRPVRQVVIVVNGTPQLITSGDMVDRKAYEALVRGGVLPAEDVAIVPEVLDATEDMGEGNKDVGSTDKMS